MKLFGDMFDLNHDGKQDQSQAVAVKDLAEHLQQPAEGRQNNLPKIHGYPPNTSSNDPQTASFDPPQQLRRCFLRGFFGGTGS